MKSHDSSYPAKFLGFTFLRAGGGVIILLAKVQTTFAHITWTQAQGVFIENNLQEETFISYGEIVLHKTHRLKLDYYFV